MRNDWFFKKFFPVFFITIFAIAIGQIAFTGWLALKAVNEVEENGGVGRALGRFVGEMQKGMAE